MFENSSHYNSYRFIDTKIGLINGLGSVVKFIKGKLDQNDSEAYDKAIDYLS